MTQNFVDSATIAQVVQCLEHGTTGQYPWSMSTVLEFTALLMREGHAALAPGLAPPKGVILDDQDLLVDLMVSQGIVSFAHQVKDHVRVEAIAKSKQWIGKANNIVNVRAEVDRLTIDRANFPHWIEWSCTKAWISHSRRLGGLADDTYLSFVSRITIS